MYFSLEPALMRIMGTPELMIKTASWQQDVNAGYRKTAVAPEHRSTRDERLGDDGLRKGDLREQLKPEHFEILTIRYDDNQTNRVGAWLRVNHLFRDDERIPKPIRRNPVLLRLWLMYELQHPELRFYRGKLDIAGKSERTVYRWKKACRGVCEGWLNRAEDEAQRVLEQVGGFRC